MRVALIQHRLTKYRVPLFNGIRNELRVGGVQFDVFFSGPSNADAKRNDAAALPWATEVGVSRLPAFGREFIVQKLPLFRLLRYDLVILPQEFSSLSTLLLTCLLFFLRRPFALWGHGKNFQPSTLSRMVAGIRAALTLRASWWFGYTDLSLQALHAQGAPADRITVVQNSAVSRAELSRIAAASPKSRDGAHVVFLGSLTESKRLKEFIECITLLKGEIPQLTAEIIGDGPQREVVQQALLERDWLTWSGALWGEGKWERLKLAKIAIIPGMIGLPIIDCFACGIPVLTLSDSKHSPEIAYLETGLNGALIDGDAAALSESAARLLRDPSLLEHMRVGALRTAEALSLEGMSARFANGILGALGLPASTQLPTLEQREHVVVIWQRFLPYHVARLKALAFACREAGHQFTAIEVASADKSYVGIGSPSSLEGAVVLFPETNYHALSARTIKRSVYGKLENLQPTVVLCPATPFPEGMGAISFRQRNACRVAIMDDAWGATDHSGGLTRLVKRSIHRGVDGAFIPATSHLRYFESLGFPATRVAIGVNAVDNGYFRERSQIGCGERGSTPYFLFVGRLLERKGIDVLLAAYSAVVDVVGPSAPHLVIVGTGPEEERVRAEAKKMPNVEFAGTRAPGELAPLMHDSVAVVVPSKEDQWALVVNEAMASGGCVIVSSRAGASTLIDDSVNGWICRAGDASSLRDRMLEAIRLTPAERIQMGRHAQAAVESVGLGAFVSGALSLTKLESRASPGVIGAALILLWPGRVAVR